MEAHADILEETAKCYKVRISETGVEAQWPKAFATFYAGDTFELRGWLAAAHAKHLRDNDFDVAA